MSFSPQPKFATRWDFTTSRAVNFHMKLPVLRERLRTFAQHRAGSLGAVDGEGDEEDGDGVAKSGGDNNSDEAFLLSGFRIFFLVFCIYLGV